MLLQSELIFTLIIYGLFSIEKITPQKIFAGVAVFIGAILIIYNGSSTVNIGDLLIVAGTAFYPIGNFFAKQALKTGTPSEILFIRSLLGGTILVILSIIFENQSKSMSQITEYWPLIIFNGLFIYHLSKILWYEGIKRIDVSKASPISIGSYPALSMLFAILFLKEVPTVYQIIGFFVVMIGILTLIQKKTKITPI
jgi:drug/metabolite transporter (DMT)-like permease